MRFLPARLTVISTIAIFTAVGGAGAQDAELIPMRDWTSDDGKVLRASLIGFEKGQGQFRTPEGRRFVVADDRLSMRDQVAILTARLNSQLEVSHSADINTDFYYSKHIPPNRRWDKIYTYVAFGPGRFNMAIALIRPGVDPGQCKEVVVRGSKGGPDAVYALRESDIRRFTSGGKEQVYARVSFVVGENEAVLKAVEEGLAANSLTFVARGGGATEHVFELDEPEANGLRETVAVYRQASKLIAEGFLKRARLTDQTPEAMAKPDAGPTLPAGTGDPLEPFRKSLAKSKYGTLQWGADVVDGVGFLGGDVVVRRRDGELARAPFAEISDEGRKHLFEKRLEEAFGKARHVYSAGVTVFLHPDWDSHRMNYSRSILLTRNDTGRYVLRLFAWAPGMKGAPLKEIYVRGDQQQTPFLITCRPGDSYTRERTDGALNTLAGTYLNAEDSGKVAALTGSRSIQFRLRSDQNQDVSVTLQEDELNVTLEAISLFQWAGKL